MTTRLKTARWIYTSPSDVDKGLTQCIVSELDGDAPVRVDERVTLRQDGGSLLTCIVTRVLKRYPLVRGLHGKMERDVKIELIRAPGAKRRTVKGGYNAGTQEDMDEQH